MIDAMFIHKTTFHITNIDIGDLEQSIHNNLKHFSNCSLRQQLLNDVSGDAYNFEQFQIRDSESLACHYGRKWQNNFEMEYRQNVYLAGSINHF